VFEGITLAVACVVWGFFDIYPHGLASKSCPNSVSSPFLKAQKNFMLVQPHLEELSSG